MNVLYFRFFPPLFPFHLPIESECQATSSTSKKEEENRKKGGKARRTWGHASKAGRWRRESRHTRIRTKEEKKRAKGKEVSEKR